DDVPLPVALSTPPTGDLWLGFSAGASAGQEYAGWLADMRFYNRVLSAAEIWQMFAPQTRYELFLATAPNPIFIFRSAGGEP
ncbi:hypothetical protein IL402_23705, partial [Escherichia coli]|uniref:hypothetical protein n=1 Tax=Escherichia coli TaxID=562 RepID=UPI001931E936